MRQRIVPLLRGNPLLIEWLQQCFPAAQLGGTQLEQAGDYETVAVPRSGAEFFAPPPIVAVDDDEAPDAYEELPAAELLADPAETNASCHMRYIGGHVVYGSKIVLPVQLSFQSMQYSSVVPAEREQPQTDDDEEQQHQQRHNESGGSYECVHEIRRMADTKLDALAVVAPDDAATVATADDTTENAVSTEAAAVAAAPVAETSPVPAAAAAVVDKCCNDTLLRAHAIRLNPRLHAQTLPSQRKAMLDMLRKPAVLAAKTEASGGGGSASPKKRGANAAEMLTSPTASPPKKKKAKRDASSSSSSSSKQSRSKPMAGKSTTTATQSNEAVALREVKIELERIEWPAVVEEAAAEESAIAEPLEDDNNPTVSEPAKCELDTDADDSMTDGNNPTDSEPPKCEQDADADDSMADENVDDDEDEDDDVETDVTVSWTRAEDKIVLEQIQRGFNSDAHLVELLVASGHLTDRTAPEIGERCAFLLDVIKNL